MKYFFLEVLAKNMGAHYTWESIINVHLSLSVILYFHKISYTN